MDKNMYQLVVSLLMVYVRDSSRTATLDDAKKLISEVGMGTFVTIAKAGGFSVSSLPIEFFESGSQFSIQGHVSAKNEQVSAIRDGASALMTVQGPHGYISPTWYDHENVPTWDYAVVHIKGTLQSLDNSGLKEHLRRQIAKYETDPKTGEQKYEASDKMVEDSINHIVGFEMQKCVLTTAFKLSQDKSAASVAGVVQGLKARGVDDLAELVADHSTRARS